MNKLTHIALCNHEQKKSHPSITVKLLDGKNANELVVLLFLVKFIVLEENFSKTVT